MAELSARLFLFRKHGAIGAATAYSSKAGVQAGYEAIGVGDTVRGQDGQMHLVWASCAACQQLENLDQQGA